MTNGKSTKRAVWSVDQDNYTCKGLIKKYYNNPMQYSVFVFDTAISAYKKFVRSLDNEYKEHISEIVDRCTSKYKDALEKGAGDVDGTAKVVYQEHMKFNIMCNEIEYKLSLKYESVIVGAIGKVRCIIGISGYAKRVDNKVVLTASL